MNLKILGCSGGIGGKEPHTTTMLIDGDILLDAGTGLSSLRLDQLVAIDHVFLSHCHLDHVAGLALLLDAVFGKRSAPVTVHASAEVLHGLKTHVFNWVIWPDFSSLPNDDNPAMRYEEMVPGTTFEVGERLITSHPVSHTPGSSAFWVRTKTAGKGFLFTGDMASTPALWAEMGNAPGLEMVIVDCSFPNAEAELASLSKHFCPSALQKDIQNVPDAVNFLIYHLKPGQEAQIMTELEVNKTRSFKALKAGDIFEF